MAGAFHHEIQLWKTNKEIEVIFLVDHVDFYGNASSSLPNLYKNVFPDDKNEYTDLQIKHFDIEKRNSLIKNLFTEFKIAGWFASIESNVELEVCLFDQELNSQLISFVKTIDKDDPVYQKDSLKKIKVYPTNQFFEKTDQRIRKQLHYPPSIGNMHKLYLKSRKCWINQEAIDEASKKILRVYYSNLRTRLKI